MKNLEGDSSANIANAVTTAFEILSKYNKSMLGSQCNQAIIIVTSNKDAPSEDLVKKYNFPHMPVRIFTFLVGGSKSDALSTMSCKNKGNFFVIEK